MEVYILEGMRVFLISKNSNCEEKLYKNVKYEEKSSRHLLQIHMENIISFLV